MSLYALLTALSLGTILGLGALGMYLSLRVMRFPDLTCGGSFPLGAVVATITHNAGVPVSVSLILGALAGAGAGYLTGVCNTIFKVPPIIASIIVMMSLYSINLLLMGKPVLSMEGADVFSVLISDGGYAREMAAMIGSGLLLVFIGGLVTWFLRTEVGLALRLTGTSPTLAPMLGVAHSAYLRRGLAVANGLVGLSGGQFAHYQRFADVNLGNSILFALLASVFLGNGLERSRKANYAIWWQIACVICGALLHRVLVASAYSIGFGAEYFSIISAALIMAALTIPVVRVEAKEVFVRS